MANPAFDVRRWTREEYEHLAEEGAFPPEKRLELIDGVIHELTPQTSWHAAAIRAAQEALQQVFTNGFDLRVQMPLALGLHSEPEPDLAVVPGHWRDYVISHPKTAVLIVEVAESSAYQDRERKRALYANFGIPDYWILLPKIGQLEVFRAAQDGDYRSRMVLGPEDVIKPLAAPDMTIRVADLLP